MPYIGFDHIYPFLDCMDQLGIPIDPVNKISFFVGDYFVKYISIIFIEISINNNYIPGFDWCFAYLAIFMFMVWVRDY